MNVQLETVEALRRERGRFATQRRRAYLLIGCIGVVLLIYDMRSLLTLNSGNSWIFVLNDMLFACSTAVLVYLGYTQRMSIERLEQLIFWLLAFESVTFNSFGGWIGQLSIQRVLIETVADDLWFLLLVSALGLHIFPQRRAVLYVAGLYLVSCGATGSYLVWLARGGAERELVGVVAQAYVICGLVIIFLYVLSRYRDQTQRLALHSEVLERLAFLDTLTGLPNRRALDGALSAQIELAERYGQPFCLALLDIDAFKQLNDRYGHQVGDQALIDVAQTARAALRVTDQIGRWGGEEFMLVLPQVGIAEGCAATERVRLSIERAVDVQGQAVTVSAGVTGYLAGDTAETLVQRADVALYRAKSAGRNRVVEWGKEAVVG